MKNWIFGSRSQIGKLIANKYYLEKLPVAKTDRNDPFAENHFDLKNPNVPSMLGEGDTAIICCGISNLGSCENDPALAFKVNVDGVKFLINELFRKNIFFVILSSSSIFEGQHQPCMVNQKPSPQSIYAKTKLEIENYCINEIKENFAILRLPKVITPDWGLLRFWIKCIEKNDIIQPFNNRWFSPINGTGVAELIYQLVVTKTSGIFQLGSFKEVLYSEFCFDYFQNYELAHRFIQPISDNDSWREKTQTPNLVTNIPKTFKFQKELLTVTPKKF